MIKKYDKCTGCFACINICPINAISMKYNKEGFLYPNIDNTKCINCGKCDNVCQINKKIIKNKIFDIYSVISDDGTRDKSSSGGVFRNLANYILEKQGIVYGAIYNPNEQVVEHTSSVNTNIDDICRSKYVQSNINYIYSEIKKQLLDNKYVLFCGTPCQVFALKLYLKNEYNNLFTCDFVCHGVPSPGLFKSYINYYERIYSQKMINITFREKKHGWRNQHICMYFENKYIESQSKNDMYYMSFLNNLTLRKSCYSCKFPSSHYSDITMLDYWEIKDDDDKGVSAVIENTNKGKFLINILKDRAIVRNIKISNKSNIFINHNKIPEYFCRLKWRKQIFNDWNMNSNIFSPNKMIFHKNIKEKFLNLFFRFYRKFII